MIFRIPRGKHRARPFRLGIYLDKNTFSWRVKFTDSCRYDLGNDDQGDTNKLCGVGYLPGRHKDSARFGWRYRMDKGLVELLAYCYVNKQRVINPIAFCEIGKTYYIELAKLSTMYYFSCFEDYRLIGEAEVPYYHNKKLGYRLGPFFGGNQVAPLEIKIELRKL
jgi:hypothetical protein